MTLQRDIDKILGEKGYSILYPWIRREFRFIKRLYKELGKLKDQSEDSVLIVKNITLKEALRKERDRIFRAFVNEEGFIFEF